MIDRFQEILTTDPVHADLMNEKIITPGNKLVEFLERPYSGDIIGIEWDASSLDPTLKWIDAQGRYITSLPADYFDKHKVWGDRRRCVRDRETGELTISANGRGDGLVLDGTEGDVLVQDPKYHVRFECGHPYYRWWVSADPHPGFSVQPWFMMRGDPLDPVAADYMYKGAKEAYGYLDGETFKLGSASGKIPVTGGVDYPGLPNTGRFTIDDAELYANNVASGMGTESFWGYCADQLLMYIEFGTLDIQSALGKGIVDLPSGEGFAGMQTGADGIDGLLAENGTGMGSGINGKTPICWRGLENPYGNIWKFVLGCNFKAAGSYRLIKRDGTGTLAGWMADGSYELGSGVALENGYTSAVLEDELGGLAIMPSKTNATSSTGMCDYFYAPNGDRILLVGGSWSNGLCAGPGSRFAYDAVSSSVRNCGARLEFRKPAAI